LAQTYGDIVYWRVRGQHHYLLNHPDYVHELLVTQQAHFRKLPADRPVRGLVEIVGQGLLFSDGTRWSQQRQLLAPAFQTQRLASYARAMVETTERLISGWRNGDERQIRQEMTELTMAIIAQTLFGADVLDEVRTVSTALAVALGGLRDTNLSVQADWLPTPLYQRAHALQQVEAFLSRLINERRDAGVRDDLLSRLLQAVTAGDMTEQQLRDEAITMFVAGHETTANALAATWQLLAQHPDIEARLHAEVDHVLAGRRPTLDDAPRLVYATMVLKEAMRLHPLPWGITRFAAREVTIGGYRIPSGSEVTVSQYVLHRDPRYFAEPERFEPERFEPERLKSLPRLAYFPFGAGTRACIGQRFAMVEAPLILATIAQRFRLRLPTAVPASLPAQPPAPFDTTRRLQLQARGVRA
jgi:cytochrome P450